jgi:3-methyladenine DNA glycosylase/8-oxoguanine DNA glycosylase
MGSSLYLVFRNGDGAAAAAVTQKLDGDLNVRLEAGDQDEALARLRFLLATDLDLGPFYRAVENDPLVGPATRRLRGYRPLRLDSVAHSLLRGIAGQLVRSREAHRVEQQAVRAVATPHDDLWLSPTIEQLRGLSPAQLRSFGLAERRARVLVRALREVDPETLEALDTPRAVSRLTSIPGIGPWTAAVVCQQGLGRTDHGLAGDLGLAKLLARQSGEVPDTEAASRLLDRYAPFQGLASAYLLAAGGSTRTPATVGEIARAVAYSGPRQGGAPRATRAHDSRVRPPPG